MAVTLDDVLRRRVPIAFRHADGGAEAAPEVGALMGAALGWDCGRDRARPSSATAPVSPKSAGAGASRRRARRASTRGVAREARGSGARGPRAPRARRRARARARKIDRALADAYPDAWCALRHENAWQLLVATILSAQCTDERVNMVTPALFARYPDARGARRRRARASSRR